ncbi:MAG: type IV pilus assembly protein PilC [Gammaproteobacteria bacterium]|jgi:type IV pilus assembly protein PilC
MPLMQYKAMDDRGKTTHGRIEAVNVADLEMRLSRMGLDLVNHREASLGSSRARRRNVRVRRPELINFCFHLEQLLMSGVPVIDALADLRDSVEDTRLREVIAGMIESIQGGETLSESMSHYPSIFDNVFVSLIRAGELSGQVGEVLRRVTENLRWQDEQAAHVKQILTYPIFMGVVVLAVIAFLMLYLVPQLVQFIQTMGETLPLHTRILISISETFVKYWFVILPLPIPLVIGVIALKRLSPAFDFALDEWKLRVWVIGPLLKKIILARFANYFALMYSSGISVLECIRISEDLVGNKAVAEAARRAHRQIADGASISSGFEFAGMFPPLVLRMLRVGESTGALDTSLLNISYFYERDVRDSIERLQALIGPAMTLLLGGLLLWVLFSVLGPIYDLIATLKV